MHCHTTISDGKQTPEEVKEVYKRQGYSAVYYTDHEVLIGHKELCDDEFVALHGYEIGILNRESSKGRNSSFLQCYHLNMIAKEQDNLMMPGFYKTNPYMAGNAREMAEKYGRYSDVIDENKYDIDWINSYLQKFNESGFLVVYNHPDKCKRDKEKK